MSSLEVVPDLWTSRPQPEDWIRQHGDDPVPVKMIDLPPLRGYLPPEALEEL